MITIKTIIELFDECPIENVMSALSFEPEKIIYVGFKHIMTEKRKSDLERFLKMRKINADISYEIVSRYDYEGIKGKLKSIISENKDCLLDLTGGKELLLTAMGAVCESENIPTIQFNVRKGELIKVKNCENLPEPKKICLSINEIITLNGGAIVENEYKIKIHLSPDFIKDIFSAWEIRRENPPMWAEYISSLRTLENSATYISGDRLEICINENPKMTAYLKNISVFEKAEFICAKKNSDRIILRYKNREVYDMLLKVGNILELYTYAVLTEFTENKPDFSDVGIGVFLDWDGVIHPYYSKEHDTINELDIVLVKGAYPIFISCKSGDLKKEALYELSTVAEKFGGKHSGKIVVTNHVSRNISSKDAILQRAKDMGIKVIYDVDEISKDEFLNLLQNSM